MKRGRRSCCLVETPWTSGVTHCQTATTAPTPMATAAEHNLPSSTSSPSTSSAPFWSVHKQLSLFLLGGGSNYLHEACIIIIIFDGVIIK